MKDASGSAGSDCVWVDCVVWTGMMPDANDWNEIEYVYDLSGRRIEKKVDGTTELKFLYDGDQIIAEYDANDTLLRKYVHGPCIDEPICLIESSGTYAGTQYYHYDALGSVVALTDASGDIVQLYEYSVYGQVAASDANHPNRFMFTGREFDKDTGLYYYRARYYHPEIGRFLQTDPIGYGDGMNRYAYCSGNPVGRVDPSGMIGVWTQKLSGEMICLRSIDPWPRYVPDEWMIDPARYAEWGTPWTVGCFWWWYVHKSGAALDLADTGLMERFKNDSIIQRIVFAFKWTTRHLAVTKWEEINREVGAWLDRADQYRHGQISAEELGDRPDEDVEFVMQDLRAYNFGPFRPQYWPDLVVLGKGYLHAGPAHTKFLFR